MRLASVADATVGRPHNPLLSAGNHKGGEGNHHMDMYAAFRPPADMEDRPCRDAEPSVVTIDARIAQQVSADDRRIAPRAPVEVDARVRELGSEGAEATVLNISSTGFMAETAGDFAAGARVWLILPGRERANAVVRWVKGKRIGAEFAQPVDLSGLLGA